MTSVVPLMAAALDQELQDRGIFSLGRADCETIIRAVLERSAARARTIEKREPAKTP
jgi:hypothetical protein